MSYGSSVGSSSTSSTSTTPLTTPKMTKAQPIFISSRSSSSSASSTSASPWREMGSTSHANTYFSSTIRKQSFDKTSAYVSDQDLLCGDMTEPYLKEPPAPPRSAEFWMAQPVFAPVVGGAPSHSRTKSSNGSVRARKAMRPKSSG